MHAKYAAAAAAAANLHTHTICPDAANALVITNAAVSEAAAASAAASTTAAATPTTTALNPNEQLARSYSLEVRLSIGLRCQSLNTQTSGTSLSCQQAAHHP